MPIVVAPSPNALLSQGDILKGVSFPMLDEDGAVKLDRPDNVPYVMVLSRNCNSVRDPTITVAPIVRRGSGQSTQDSDPKKVTLDTMRRRLLLQAEGGVVQDNFYLGPLDDTNVRFAAHLGTLACIRVPTEKTTRQNWIASKRVWSLHMDFIHDLHFRLFATYARLGFDDHSWYPDSDLEQLILAGEGEVAGLQREIIEEELQLSQNEGDGNVVSPKRRESLESKKAKLEEAKKELQPYLDERARRKAR